jgi:acyl-CoA thioesterase I
MAFKLKIDKKFMNICIFGDSITHGAFDQEKGGWANRLRLHLDNLEDFEDEVYNLGVSGDNTEGLLERFEAEAKFRESGFLIFAIGINDSQYVISENQNRIPIEKFEQNIQELIARARKITNKILFVGLTSVDEAKTVPSPWNSDKMYKNEYVEKYNNIIKKVCENEKVDFIDIFSEMIKENYVAMLFDGLHPDSKGHKWIADRIVKDIAI